MKNLITQNWADKEAEPGQPLPFSLHEQDRAMIRDAVVDAVVLAPDIIRYICYSLQYNLLLKFFENLFHSYSFYFFRVQLSICVSHIVKHDFPGRWTEIVDKINIYLQNPDASGWPGALLCLYQLVKNFE